MRPDRPTHVASRTLLAAVLLVFAGCSSAEKPLEEPAPPARALEPGERSEDLEPFKVLLGLSLAQAEAWLQDHPTASPVMPGRTVTIVRPTRIDGEGQAVTADLVAERINVEVERGVIVALDSVG